MFAIRFNMKNLGYFFLLVFIIPVRPALIFPQTLQATVRGILTDSSGDVLPNVHLTAIHEETRSVYRTQSNSDGEYTFPTLDPGTYIIEAELDGFKKNVLPGICTVISAILTLSLEF